MLDNQLSQRQIMNRIYKDISGFEIPKNDEKHVKNSAGSPVYGEITIASIDKLIDHLKLSSKDVFFDLGSGVGKVVIQVAANSKVKKAVGIELSKTRHKDACIAFKKAVEYLPQIQKRCEFICDDLLEADLKAATVIYTCSTAFSQKFMVQVAKMLLKYKHPFLLVSLQDLPIIKGFKQLDTLKLNMSWMRNTPVHFYKRCAD